MMQESASRGDLGKDKEKWQEKQGYRGQIPAFKKGRRVGKRLFAFFLAMLLAASPLETVSFAEEVSASPLQVKETEAENQKEVSSNEVSSYEVSATEPIAQEEPTAPEPAAPEASSPESSPIEGTSSVTDSLEGTKKAAKFILNSEETEIEGLSEAGVRITAKYPESTFPLDVQMEVKDIKEESLLEEMKEKDLQRAKLQDARNHLKEDSKNGGNKKEEQN